MRLLISFFLSLFIYLFFILSFFYFVMSSNESKKLKEVYIHQAILKNDKKQNIQVKKSEQVIKKSIEKIKSMSKNSEQKTKDTFSKAGKEIKFDDIFANTSDNIPTKKIVQKKQKDMTKKKGNNNFSKLVKKELSKLESNIAIDSNSNKESSEYVLNEFEKVWSELDTIDGNFVTLKIDVDNANINLFVISTNLDTILLNKFLNKLKQIDISKIKNFHGTITFNTKLKGK
jgi:hypothetical protein